MGVQLQYALVDGVKSLPFKNAQGKSVHGECPHCHQEVIANVCTKKLSHWAHKPGVECDRWWENKTEWHRRWQSQFPSNWQEVTVFANEKLWHIADVCTPDGLVIEFQHSSLNDLEKDEREKFYCSQKNGMVWVVDAGGKAARKHFIKNANDDAWPLKFDDFNGIPICLDPLNDVYFPEVWVDRAVTVFFDLRIGEDNQDKQDHTDVIYCVFPYQIMGNSGRVLTYVSLEDFRQIVDSCKSCYEWKQKIMNELRMYFERLKKEKEERDKMLIKEILINNDHAHRRYRSVRL